jgi:hypothetical protein
MSADFDPEEEEAMRARLSAELVRPAGTFQGKELWPFSKAARAIFSKFTTNEDTIDFCGLAFVYILTKRSGTTFKSDVMLHIVAPFWDNRAAFVSEILSAFDAVTPADQEAANRLMDESMKMGLFSQVQALPKPGKPARNPQKKTKSGRPVKRGNASRSRKR